MPTQAEITTPTANLPERLPAIFPRLTLDGLRSMPCGGEWEELLDLLDRAPHDE